MRRAGFEVIGDDEEHMEPLKIAEVLFELRFNKYIDTNEGVTKLYSPRRARAEARIQQDSKRTEDTSALHVESQRLTFGKK